MKERENKLNPDGKGLYNSRESLRSARYSEQKTTNLSKFVEKMIIKKTKRQQDRRKNSDIMTKIEAAPSEEQATNSPPTYTLPECSTSKSWKFKNPLYRETFNYERVTDIGKEKEDDLNFEVIFNSENLKNNYGPSSDNHYLNKHISKDVKRTNVSVESLNTVSDILINKENSDEKFNNNNYFASKNLECCSSSINEKDSSLNTSVYLMNINQSSKQPVKASPSAKSKSPTKSTPKAGKSVESIKKEKTEKKEEKPAKDKKEEKPAKDKKEEKPAKDKKEEKPTKDKKDKETIKKVESLKSPEPDMSYASVKDHMVLSEDRLELDDAKKAAIKEFAQKGKKEGIKADNPPSIDKGTFDIGTPRKDVKAERIASIEEDLMPRQRALDMPLASQKEKDPKSIMKSESKPISKIVLTTSDGKEFESPPSPTRKASDIPITPKETKPKDKTPAKSKEVITTPKSKDKSKEIKPTESAKSKQSAKTPQKSKSMQDELLRVSKSKSKDLLKDDKSKSKSKEKPPSETAEDDYIKNLIGGDTKKPIELNHYKSEEFIGSMLYMRGGWRFNINFSEIVEEQTAPKSEIKESQTPIQTPSKTNQSKEKLAPKESTSKSAANANFGALYCNRLCIRATFEQFVKRWKKDAVRNIFESKSKLPPKPDEKEVKEEEVKEEVEEVEKYCVPKQARVNFSLYRSEPKNFGERDLCLFCAQRTCKCCNKIEK